MTAATIVRPTGRDHTDANVDLCATISTSAHSFLQPTLSLQAAAVLATKRFLDPLATGLVDSQTERRDQNRKKRKRGIQENEEQVLQLRQIYTHGFGVNQIWEQSRRILDAAIYEIERAEVHIARIAHQNADQSYRSRPDAESYSGNESSNLAPSSEEGGGGLNGSAIEEDGAASDVLDEEEEEEHIEGISEDDLGRADDGVSPENDHASSIYVSDPNGLNDGFFSIDDFNKHSQFLEQQDARGEGDNPSDEDEVDWDADPLSTTLTSLTTRRKINKVEDNDSEDSDDDGPTFDNVDLVASDTGDEELGNADMGDEMTGLANTNEVKYADFFEPPPKKPSKNKRLRALPKTQPPKSIVETDDVGTDIQRAMDDVRRDLLDSEDEPSDDEESDSDVGGAVTRNTKSKNLSTHEKQRAKIATEIRRLEAANVSKRDWTLSGEARAADRPMNSLIEEDLEFERVGKPVPVITAEVSEEIEALIKRRIVAREFDEVIRRRPEAAASAAATRRGRVEVDDTKPEQGLADVYEQEHLRNTDLNYVDKRSVATKKQHDEITRLWKEVSSQLDLLSNLHFKPKRVEAEIKTVGDKPVIGMEDARPMGAGGEENRLAPQEIYRPGEEGRRNGEVVLKSGANVNKEEMTREEKLRRRRREKERAKKSKDGVATAIQAKAGKEGKKSKREEKDDILTQLRKGGVKVVGKKGEMENLEKSRSGHGGVESGGALKL